jgi:glycerate dehydrogenase
MDDTQQNRIIVRDAGIPRNACPQTPREITVKIAVLDGATLNPGDNPWTGLEELGNVVVYDRTKPDQLIERARDAGILVINKVRITEEALQQLPNLKFVTVTATGFDCVDSSAAKRRGIPVSNVPIYGTDSVAQHVFALLLHILHRIDIHDEAVHNGEWGRCGDFSFWKLPLTELTGKQMGIIGHGRIGRRVGELANGFGMKVVAHSRRHSDQPGYAEFAWSELPELVESSDVISLHCPLTDETRGIINRDLLSRCRPSAILINASRGPLVVEQDLADALVAGTLRAAGVDVVSSEPIANDNPLLSAPNCVITPHQAWATLDARRRLLQITVANVAAFLAGRPQNVVWS